ncbi:cation-transporting ATPase [Tremella mesenterica]|uniref:Cation-transporting ATPase n=1 Tax=Tremella mesenterica TaxID=5217 RepID=A0A4Q1BGA4_TREME|nr:cation-transporting ATPase [Tremella mesenterica]
MRLSHFVLGILSVVSALYGVRAETETYKYESDITRLRALVIHSLYSHKDVFLRELLSNANDALEKLRLVSLTDRSVLSSGEANVTIEVKLDEGGKTGKLILKDTGIGMTKDELAKNLGTIARSGTSEFLRNAEQGGGGTDGNLIGQFGMLLCPFFLVSPTVQVSSLPPATSANPTPQQHTFVSTAAGDSFEIFPDPRGNTLGRGTEIILSIGEEDGEFLSVNKLKNLIDRHSTFSTTFPIYIKERKVTKEPETESPAEEGDHDELDDSLDPDVQVPKDTEPVDEGSWVRVNDRPPLWMREPKDVTDEEYREFYKAVAKDPKAETLGWSHFKGDTGSGVSYRGIMYIPAQLPKDFWQKVNSGINNVRLMVKRVFITDDLGEEYMPRWLSFLKVTVDADDLPLNVSREQLQNNRFLQQLQRILVRKALDLFTKMATDEPGKYQEVSKLYGNAFRIGLMESAKDKIKLAKLLRFESTRTNYTSLEEASRLFPDWKIYYMAGVGEPTEALAGSPFVEKLKARGYEVLLLNLPADEPMMSTLNNFMGMKTQDVSKKGLKYGDEDEDEAEKRELESQKIAFAPLLNWLKTELSGQISDAVVLTNRLVSSPCTIVVDSYGWSANMQRIMASQAETESDPMYAMMKNLPKVLEINPKSPLIEGLLERVLELPEGDEDMVSYELEDLRETVKVLFDTSLVRSGFSVSDPMAYFSRVEALLRRSLGVSLSAKGAVKVKPAPPQAMGPMDEDGVGDDLEGLGDLGDLGGLGDLSGEGFMNQADLGGDEWLDWAKIKAGLKEDKEHDEL